MSVWMFYQLFFFGGIFISFLIFFFIAVMGSVTFGLIIMTCGILFIVIASTKIVCPKCKTPLSSSTSLFSKHYRGYIIVPKKCVNCSFDLVENI